MAISHAQGGDKDPYRIVQWDAADGLSLAYKNAMIRDVNGFLWVASPGGLNKFDGNRFQQYFYGQTAKGNMPGSYCFSIVEDSLHQLWVGTNRGLLCYNAYTDSFQSILPRTNGYADITSIVPFWASNASVFCLEQARMITSYDIRTKQRKVLSVLPENPGWKNNIAIALSVYDSLGNSIWIPDSEKQGGLWQLDLSFGTLVHHAWTCFDGRKNHNHRVEGIAADFSNNQVWVNSEDGLLQFDLREKQFRRPNAFTKKIIGEKYHAWPGIALDPGGDVWMATEPAGVLRYTPATGRIRPVFEDSAAQHMISDACMRIYFDEDDMVWFGYGLKRGMMQLIPFMPAVQQYHRHVKHSDKGWIPDRVHNIILGDGNSLWMGSSTGPLRFDPQDGTFDPLPDQMRPANPDQHLFPLGLNSDAGIAWFYEGQKERVYAWNLKERRKTEILFDAPGQSPQPHPIAIHHTRPLLDGLLVQLDLNGIYLVRPGKQQAERIASIPHHVTNVAVTDNRYVFIRFHFTGRNLCYGLRDGQWRQVVTPIDSLEWNCITYDEKTKTYWVGGFKELYHFDQQFRLLEKFGAEEGITGSGILAILIDDESKTWFCNADGRIFCIDAANGKIRYLTRQDGYTANQYFWQIPFIKDRMGNLYFAGAEGIDRINPGALKTYKPPQVYVSDIRINGVPLKTRGEDGEISTISLTHRQRNLAIETGVLDFYSEKEDLIRYKLEGTGDEWQVAPANHTIQYQELSPGNYKLRIQASRSGHTFQGPEKILEIRMHPAIWDRSWFQVLLFSVIGLVIYLLVRYGVHQRYKARLARSVKDSQLAELAQQTAELQQKSIALEMQALRAQMNPHFIFNSLNAINRFILQNDRKQASGYLSKFSRLVRLILENSKESLISLERELEALNLYLELESLRFEGRFNFKVSVPQELLEAEIKVPPLIIQPFAENAIWHGLMQKQEKGQLDIEISSEKDHLYIRIADDGIGRKQAAARADQSMMLHKSMGQQITLERISLLGQRDAKQSSVSINDLVGPDGRGAGTEVIIEIPVMYD
jgi:streptogramin lyase